MFIEALFIKYAKIWKQPKCLSTDKWIKMWYVYTGTHTHTQNGMLAIKNEILPFASNVDRPREYYAKWNKTEKDKYCTISLICGI